MTHTDARGAADRAGARIDADACGKAVDFLPLDGIDQAESWVGNARQASNHDRALWGSTPVAFSGLETKVRDRASYVADRRGRWAACRCSRSFVEPGLVNGSR